MARLAVVSSSLIALSLLTLRPSDALATDAPRDVLMERPSDDPFRSIALTANPLSVAVGRIGLNVEWLPAAHHAIVANPFVQIAYGSSETGAGTSRTVTEYAPSFGGELGYRFYTGRRSANGFFIGPFGTLQSASSTTTTTTPGQTRTLMSDYVVYGGGLDLGGQHVFRNGFTIGGGAGLMYLAMSSPSGPGAPVVRFEGVLPRVLFTAGYAF